MKNNSITVLQLCSYLRNNVFHTRFFESLGARNISQKVVSPHAVPASNQPNSSVISTHFGTQEQWSLSHKLIYSWKMWSYSKHLNQISGLDSMSVIHAHTLYADGLLAHVFSKKHNIPLIITIRDSDINAFPKYYPHWRKTACQALHHASKVIFVNPNFRDYLEEKHAIRLSDSQCETIPNGVDDIWHETPLSKKPAHEETRVICVGVLSPRKNQLGLINAIKIANKNSDKKYTLTLAGKPVGAYGDAVLKQCEEHSWINYLGELTTPKLLDAFQDHDIFALISHTENFGLVYGEALACGIPIIYSKGQGFDGWSSPIPYGVAVDSRNIDEVAEALMKFDFDVMTTWQRKEFSKKLFKWSMIAAEHETLYQSILYKPKRP